MHLLKLVNYLLEQGWSGGAMVLGKLPVPGRLTIWVIVGQGPIALAVGAGVGCLDIFFSPLSFLSSFSLSLGDECLRYRLKYYLKGPLNPQQPTNQPTNLLEQADKPLFNFYFDVNITENRRKQLSGHMVPK